MTDTTDHDVRAMLTERAAEVQVDAAGAEAAIGERLVSGDTATPVVISLDEHRRPRWLGAAAAAAVVAIIGIGVVLATDEDDQVETTPADTTPPDTAPETAPPPVPDGNADVLYRSEGTAEQVAAGYLKDRLDGFANVEVELIDERPDLAAHVGWRTFEQVEPGAEPVTMFTGSISLQSDDDGRSWKVTDARTDGVEVDWSVELDRDGRRVVRGTSSSSGDESIAVQLVGDTTSRADLPPGGGAFELAIPRGDTDLRVQHIGGTYLSITETAVSRVYIADRAEVVDAVARAFVEERFGDEIVNSSGSIDAIGAESSEGVHDRATSVIETASGATIEVHLRAPTGTDDWKVVEAFSPGFGVNEEDADFVITSPESGSLTASDQNGAILAEDVRVEAGEVVRFPGGGAEYLELMIETDEGPVLRYYALR